MEKGSTVSMNWEITEWILEGKRNISSNTNTVVLNIFCFIIGRGGWLLKDDFELLKFIERV